VHSVLKILVPGVRSLTVLTNVHQEVACPVRGLANDQRIKWRELLAIGRVFRPAKTQMVFTEDYFPDRNHLANRTHWFSNP
jgi:hypothetical protein